MITSITLNNINNTKKIFKNNRKNLNLKSHSHLFLINKYKNNLSVLIDIMEFKRNLPFKNKISKKKNNNLNSEIVILHRKKIVFYLRGKLLEIFLSIFNENILKKKKKNEVIIFYSTNFIKKFII